MFMGWMLKITSPLMVHIFNKFFPHTPFESPKSIIGMTNKHKEVAVRPESQKNIRYVYHSSKTQGLKTIQPRVSTHRTSWVYALEKPEYCLMFLGNHSDAINQTGFINGIPYIAERFESALEYAYKNKRGSIYTLEGLDFKTGMTTFTSEFVCDHSCKVINEKKIEDVLKEILHLESEEKIKIYRYPDVP